MLNHFRPYPPRRLQAAQPQPQQQQPDGKAEVSDLMTLADFDIALARLDSSSNYELNFATLSDIVTAWMNGSFETYLKNLGYADKYADFSTVILLQRLNDENTRMLVGGSSSSTGSSSTSNDPLTAPFKGAALFSRNATQLQVPADVMSFIEETTLNNKTGLLTLLQESSEPGLGNNIVDVHATKAVSDNSSNNSGDSNNGSLEVIIIIAVAVAGVAFIVLLLAIFWAWRYDKKNREAYLASKDRTDPTASNSTMDDHHNNARRSKNKNKKNPAPVREIGMNNDDSIVGGGGGRGGGPHAGLYPESVISEDISTSLSQYYRSGLHNYSAYSRAAARGASGGASGNGGGADHLNDAASVSSMESYGYSLDGYAPSISHVPMDIPITHGDLEQDVTAYNDDDDDVYDDSDTDPEEKF